jgi:hypothetical protein
MAQQNYLRSRPGSPKAASIYWGLLNHGFPGLRGMEKTPEEYVAGMVEVFREAVRRRRRKAQKVKIQLWRK